MYRFTSTFSPQNPPKPKPEPAPVVRRTKPAYGVPWLEKHPELAEIALAVAAAFRVTVEQMCGRSRKRWIITARIVFIKRAYATGKFSSVDIGRALNRDHTTILHHLGHLRYKNKPRWVQFVQANDNG